MANIQISQLSKSFGAHRVFDALDLEIPDRAYVCLLGPSGCGKSTLMRIISGLDSDHTGSIRFDGHAVESLSSADRDIGMAFQNYALYPHHTVEGNLRFPLLAPKQKGRWSSAEMTKRVHETADLLRITPLLHRTIDQLSGGQQQRVSLGRALIRHPKVLLLDEPVTHLDARLRFSMRSELKQIHKTMGTTTIHVTHDQQEALAMADVLVIMRNGRIEQSGPGMRIYRDPDNSFVAGFLGDAMRTLLTIELAGEGRARLDTYEFALPDDLASLVAQAPHREITLALPNTSFSIDPTGPLTGTVVAHEMIENTQRIVLKVAGQRIKLLSNRVERVKNGDGVRIRVGITDGMIFDKQSGQRLRA
ncbi:ABC transporter ATP-binding protein [Primorskyibacter flagellatus]|uniref:Multiple sugar transport system ATP-binding protein n=1 Tax=Primorskyibacter flagellatus TaxID=1387277 RepID=A0A1W2EB49_9RHOB|nr:ABC transporter ATP-binding protein [Primorskyibacter flagellatus]SMD06566.1 multiple sugar transport system ATP-binding protein [Primorskyibacter flagellatus]